MQEYAGQKRRVVVVFNPNAGQAEALEHALHDACMVWRQANWSVDLRPTSGPGDGTMLARAAAAEGYDTVVAAGGDGTVNEVVNGLVGTNTALGALPVGTMNVWVREIGLPLQPRAAAEALLHCVPRRIDVGKAGDRYFLLMASIGFDAEVTALVSKAHKRRLGALAYIVEGLRLALRYQGVRARIVIDGTRLRGRYLMVVLGNSQLYGGMVKLTAHALIDDGLLDVCLIKGTTLRAAPLRLWSIFTRRYDADSNVQYFRAREFYFMSTHPMRVQVDGDPIGTTPVRVTAIPAGLIALLPPHLPTHLLQGTYG